VASGVQDASGVISGSANLTSAGNLTLNGANTYTRGTALTAGTLSVGGTSALGSGELLVTSGASLDASTAGARIANQISLGGTLNFRGSNSLTAELALALSADSTLNVIDNTLTLAGTIVSGGSVLTKEGVGTLALTGTNSDVALTINAGSITAGNEALTAPATTVTIAGPGTLSLLGNQSIDTVSGSGNLLLGSSSLTLANGGIYSGVINGDQGSFLNLTAGNLTISGNSPAFGGTLAVNGGAVDLAGTIQRVGSAILNGGTIQNGTLDFGRLTLSSGNYNAQLRGGGELIKDRTAATVSLGADNSAFTGGATVSGGTLSLEHENALTSAVRVTLDGNLGSATLRVGTSNVTVMSLNFGFQSTVELGTNTLTLQAPDGMLSDFRGSISSAAGGSLVLAGLGTQILKGDSTGATFRTEVQSGILEIQHELALGHEVNEVALSGGKLSLNTPGVLAARHNLTSTGASSLTLAGIPNQTLGDLSLAGTLSVTGGIDGAIQSIAFEDTTLANAANINVGSYASVSFGTLTGNNDLTKSGNGSLTLTAANSGTAATAVTGGSLIIGASGSLASGNLTIDGTGTVLDLGSTSQTVAAVSVINGAVQQGTLTGTSFSLNNATISAQLIGSGALTSTGATTLSGQNTYTGGTTVNGGSLTVTSTGSLDTAGNLAVSQGAFANFLGTNVTLGSISGAGTTLFSGTANITAAITEGVVTVEGAANTALGGGALNLNGSGSTLTDMTGGTLTLAANKVATVATFTNGDASVAGTLRVNAGTFGGTLRGEGSLDVLNGSDVTLNGSLGSFTGAYTVNASTLSIGSATSDQATLALLSGGTANLNFDGGSLREVANEGRLVLTNGTITLGALTGSGVVSSGGTTNLKVGSSGGLSVFAGSITGGIALTKEGNGRFDLTGSNDFTGTASVSSGTLSIGAGGTSGAITAAINVASGAEVRFNRSDALSYGAVISGSGALVKLGEGTTTLSGANTYTGLTLVNQGTLVVTGGLALANNLDVVTGARADLNYAGASLGTVNNAGVVNFGSTAIVTNLSGSGTTSFQSNAQLGTVSNGTVSVGGNTVFTNFNGGSLTATGSVNGTSVTGGSLNLNGNGNRLQSVLGGDLNLGGSTDITLLSSGSVLNRAATSVGTFSGGQITNDGAQLTVSNGRFLGLLSGSGALNVNGNLTLAGQQENFTGNISVSNGGSLTMETRLSAENAVTVATTGRADFAAGLNEAQLSLLDNAGSVSFDAEMPMWTHSRAAGRTLFSQNATLLGGIGSGVVDILGNSDIGRISGGTVTLGGDQNEVLSIEGNAQVTTAKLTVVGELIGGTINNSGILGVSGGSFSGSLQGTGTVLTAGSFTVRSMAVLAESLRHASSTRWGSHAGRRPRSRNC
jgi:fibronectin-binding autotransporter adhesin